MSQILKSIGQYLTFHLPLIIIFLLGLSTTYVNGQGCIYNKQYAKTYSANGFATQHSILQLADKSIIVGGPVNDKMLLEKTDLNGNIVWSKSYSTPRTYANPFTPSALDIDGSIACALANNYITKLDTAGNILSTAELTKKSGTFTFFDIGILSQGDKVVLLSDDGPQGTNGYILARLSADLSTVVWTKYFSATDAYYKNILIDGDKILMSGFIAYKSNILCFNAADGTLINQSNFIVENRNNTIINIYKYNGGYLAQGYLYVDGSAPPEDNQMIVNLSPDLTPVKAYRFTNIDKHLALSLAVEPDGGFYGAFGWDNNSLMYVNKNGQVDWATSNTAIPVSTPVRILKNADGLITSSLHSSNANGNTSWFFALAKSDTNGTFVNCPYNNITVSTVPLTFSKTDNIITARDTSIISINKSTASSENTPLVENTLCSTAITCSTIKIVGDDKVCKSTSQASFIGRRNAGCTLPMHWSIVGDSIQQETPNDSTINVGFLKSGTYKFILRLGENCSAIADSLEVNATVLPSGPLSLGRDTTICYGDSLLLHSQPGYASYLWQDNSSDTILKVHLEGSYSVTTTDVCGNVYKDTINIKTFSPTPFELGPAQVKCNNDPINITAPEGFVEYTWTPGTFNNTNSVMVNPSASTIYTVAAKSSNGCLVKDSIGIIVHNSPAITLGKDRSFCNGDSLSVNNGDSFKSYKWSTGETTPTILIKSKGSYAVTATTSEGCNSADTIQVDNVFASPVVHLNKDTAICSGTNKVLDAGSGYVTYFWSNASNTQTIVVNSIDTYWVKVTDTNGCQGTDTSRIKLIATTPTNFLPPNKSICADSSFRIQPNQSFSSYLWNTGDTVKSIEVKKAGTYWLQAVTNNCTGKSYINIKVNPCNTGFYIPNAFTPNGDGMNDIFKPLLYGEVTYYRFSIYNRWGQRVFETSELGQGWNGLFNNKDDGTKTYIWTCVYQIEGGTIKNEKGTVMLIR